MKIWFFFFIFLLTVNAAASPSQSSQWQFKVLLDNREIGTHHFTVSESNGRQTIQTDANGKPFLVEGNLVAGQAKANYFQVNTAGTETELPPCVMTFAYWNPIFLDEEKLLNSQTGIYEDVTITRIGEVSLQLDGEAVAAVKYLIDLKAGPITLWYSANNFRWLALESVAAGGCILRYEPLTITSNGGDAASIADSQQ